MRTVVCAAVAALCLAACGAPSDPDTPTIGLLAPLTGASAATAQEQANAVRLAVDGFNAAGGVGGRPVALEVYDTQLLPNVAIQQAQRAITQDGVAALLGPFSTSEALAVKILIDRAEVPTITGSASTDVITRDTEYFFRTTPLATELAEGLVATASTIGVREAVVLYDSGAFGLVAKPLVETAAQRLGVTLTRSVQYPIGAADLTPEVAKAAQGSPQAVILAGTNGADYGLVAKTMTEQGLDVPLLGFSPIVLPDAIGIAGGAYEELPGVYTVQAADRTKPEYLDLLDEYNSAFDDLENLPEQVLGIHDAARFALEALRASGGAHGAALKNAMEALPPRVGANGRTGSEQRFGPGRRDAFDGVNVVPYRMENGVPVQDTSISLS